MPENSQPSQDSPARVPAWLKKAFATPAWLGGVAVGALAVVITIRVFIPHEQYATAVQNPTDRALARVERTLDVQAASRLAAARFELARGQMGPAIGNLNLVLLDRPDNQEARWLLATADDALGDVLSAAKAYRVYLNVEAREQSIRGQRVERAKARLAALEALP
jgi:predicted Zn-dependent protease